MRTTALKCGQPLLIGLLAFVLQTNGSLAKDRLEEQFHHSYPLNADGQLKLDNVNGRIRITAWDRTEIQVDAVKHADRQQDLAATKIEIDSKPERITIHTKHPNSRKNNSISVDYEVKVPTGAHLAGVETVNGNVEIEGVRGPVYASSVNGRLAANRLASDTKLETVNGKVEAVFEHLDGVKSISLEAVNGRLELTLPANANADVKAESLNGHIEADKLRVKKNWPVGSELNGKLGQGGTRVKAETVNGGIRVKLAGPDQKPQVEAPEKS